MIKKEKQAKQKLILLMVIIPMMLLCFFWILPKLPSSTVEKDIFWSNKILTEPTYDFVVTGDSRIYRGVDIRSMEKELKPLKGFNYGFSSAGIDKLLLENAISKLSPSGKRILVVGISPNSFLESSLQNKHLKLWLDKSKKDLIVKKYLYPVMRPFNTYTFSDLYKMYKGELYYERFDINHGFVASDKKPADSSQAIQAYKEQFKNEVYSKEAEAEFMKLLIQYKKAGIQVFILRVPVSESMYKLEDRMFQFDLHWSVKLANRDIPYISFEYDNSSFFSYDGSHINSKSAKYLGKFLGKGIARKLIK